MAGATLEARWVARGISGAVVGGPKQYRECHYPEDHQRSTYELVSEEWTVCRLVPVGGKAPGLGDDVTLGAVRPADVNDTAARPPFGVTVVSVAFGSRVSRVRVKRLTSCLPLPNPPLHLSPKILTRRQRRDHVPSHIR